MATPTEIADGATIDEPVNGIRLSGPELDVAKILLRLNPETPEEWAPMERYAVKEQFETYRGAIEQEEIYTKQGPASLSDMAYALHELYDSAGIHLQEKQAENQGFMAKTKNYAATVARRLTPGSYSTTSLL